LSDSVVGGIIGALLAGGFLIVGQLVASAWQANISRDASAAQAAIVRDTLAAQAAMAREAWERSQRAQAHAQLEAACLEVIRYIQQIQTATENWENGNMTSAEGLTAINSAAAAVLQVGYSILLRRGLDDPIGPLIGQVVNQASEFTGLYGAGRTPPATIAEKKAQVAVVANAATAVYSHMHKMLMAETAGN
jgi:hypothetical protein